MCKLKVIPENYIVENRRGSSVFKESNECTMMSEVGIILVKADNKDSLLKLIKKLYGRDNMKIRYVDATMYIDTDYFKDDMTYPEPMMQPLYGNENNKVSVVQRRYINIDKTKNGDYVLKLQLYFPEYGGLDNKDFRYISEIENWSKEFGVDIKGRGFSDLFYREYSIKNGKKKRYRFAWYNQMFYRFY